MHNGAHKNGQKGHFLRPTKVCLPHRPQRVEYKSKRWDLKTADCVSCAGYAYDAAAPPATRLHSTHQPPRLLLGCYGVRMAPTYPCNHHSQCSSRAHRRPSRAAAPRWTCDHSKPRCEGACHHSVHGRARRGERASMHAMESKGGGWLGAMGAGCGRRGMANLPHGDAAACTAARTKMAKLDIFVRPTKVCLPPSPR